MSQERLYEWSLKENLNIVKSCKTIICRGSNMKTTVEMYKELSAAWQFPYYFGWNAAAVVDCLSDLAWMPASIYNLIIYDADMLLMHEPISEIIGLFADFQEVARRWREDMPSVMSPQHPLRFQVILQVSPGNALPYEHALTNPPQYLSSLAVLD
ncbi:MAG: barstar family protein [Alphaproteobacteria bacterium]|nr:barstar family protein [Alphaproteobacteria bacterium]